MFVILLIASLFVVLSFTPSVIELIFKQVTSRTYKMKSLILGIVSTNLLFLLSSNSNVLVYAQEEKKQQDDLVFNVQGFEPIY